MRIMNRETHTIDATNKSLGRLATEIADLLRGKKKVGFAPYKDEGDFVKVGNIAQMKITGRKFKQKKYYHHTGYLGNLKEITMEKLADKKGIKEVLRKAVFGMLPKNKLRAQIIKRLSFKQ